MKMRIFKHDKKDEINIRNYCIHINIDVDLYKVANIISFAL